MAETRPVSVPVFQEYMNPILEVLRREGRALTIEQLDKRVIDVMRLPTEVASVPHDAEKPDRSEVSYRIAWSRSYLKKAGLLDNPARARWGISDKGSTAGEIDAYELAVRIGEATKSAAAAKSALGDAPSVGGEASDVDEDVDEELLTARVGEELAREIRGVHDRLAADGELLATDRAAECVRRFRERFGPDALRSLDGEALLETIHGRGKLKNSLVYWLEFKDDADFPAHPFGSIGGGSALKFGIYLAAESGQWMTGNGRQQTRLTLDEAIDRARAHRDQLVAGTRVLANLPADVEAIDFFELQAAMVSAAPDVAETSWGHKYFALLFPNVLEPFHGADYQIFHLRKLLKLPASGRYENARIFAGVAAQLGMPLLDLGAVMYRRNGSPHGYWRVGTTVNDASEWDRMRSGGFTGIGWDALGDLTGLTADQDGKQALRDRLAQHYPSEASTITKATNQIAQFAWTARDGDLILAMEGARVRGVGKLAGAYYFRPGDGPCPHRRTVEWLRVGDWKLPRLEGMRTTFVPIRKDVNIVETEARLLGVITAPAAPVADTKVTQLLPLVGHIARIDAVLQRKRQAILHGPPGTGKTYWADRAVDELAARAWFGVSAVDLDDARRRELVQAGAKELCSFHPAYGYEDFLEGFRPVEKNGSLSFELRDGVFKRLCARAARTPTKPFFLIVDEINRGDIPRIFGELLTVLEKDKRGRVITLPLSAAQFSVPDNVYVIGTMNTADRSIALLDAALRRRFGFVELLPDSTVLSGVVIEGLPLGAWLDELNRRIVQHAGRDARHLQVGQSYLMPGGTPVRELGRFVEILRDDVMPLLQECCYEDFEALEKILGPKLIQRSKRQVDASLFESPRHPELVQALLSAFADITATKEAVEADVADKTDDKEEDAGVLGGQVP